MKILALIAGSDGQWGFGGGEKENPGKPEVWKRRTLKTDFNPFTEV